jgi:hypothetical protein
MPEITTRVLINVFLAAGAIFAMWQGRSAERASAIVVIANVLIGQGFHELNPAYDSIVRLVNDGLSALALLGITLRFGAPWMGGVMLFFAAQFSLHSYYLVMSRSQSDRLHAIVNNVNWSGIAWCLIIGTAVAWRLRVVRARQTPAA